MDHAKSLSLRLVLLLGLGLAYAVFMVVAAFAPATFAGPVYPGATVSFWFVYGIALIWSVVLATGLYILSVNSGDDA